MARLDRTLANLAPGVSSCADISGRYNPRHGLAIYFLSIPGYSPSAPGVVLGEALAARSGLGCTLLDGIPTKIPEGAVVIGDYTSLKASRPDLFEDIPELPDAGQYAIKLQRHALIVSHSIEGLANGMQTLAMLTLRHSEETLPCSVVLDTPWCQTRGMAVELQAGEIGINLLMQMASFAATFKANHLQLILQPDFDSARDVPGIDSFIQTCHSYGITIEVRLPWLKDILTGTRTLHQAWTGLRSIARLFGAECAALDDRCPDDADPERIRRVGVSLARGEVGLKGMSVDYALLERSGIDSSEFRTVGVGGWYRWGRNSMVLLPEDVLDLPIRFDVEAPLTGFTGESNKEFYQRLDGCLDQLVDRPKREVMVSFRNIGVSHMWQNMLYPAATAMIAAWGNPRGASRAARCFSELLYGDSADTVMDMWRLVGRAFPPGLDRQGEMLVRRTAFGHWPEEEESARTLVGINWLDVIGHIRTAAESLKNTASGLSRNATTLTGAKLCLHALSWLHCFLVLTPELERRRRDKYDGDGRTEVIANELYNNFRSWQGYLEGLNQESGLEIAELHTLEAMGLRLKGLCEGIFE